MKHVQRFAAVIVFPPLLACAAATDGMISPPPFASSAPSPPRPIGTGSVEVSGHPDPISLLDDEVPAYAANKHLVFDMWRSIVNAGHVELADDMLVEGYIQHSPVLPTGRAAFKHIFSAVTRTEIPELVTPPLVAILAEGDLVVMALREGLTGPDGTAYSSTHFNLFRIEQGRLAEHWHSVQSPPGPDLPPPGQGGPWLITGASGAAQLALLSADDPALAANKRLVFDAWREVLDAGRSEAVAHHFSPDYIEHDPNFTSGHAGLLARAMARGERPVADTLDANIVAIVAQGDLITIVTSREHPHPHRSGATYTTAHFDMFRLAGRRIAEHWSGEAKPGGLPVQYGE